MCKFRDEKDGNYRTVAEVLARWAKELKEETKEEETETVGPTSSLQETETESDSSLEESSRTANSETTTKGNSLESTSRKAQRTLPAVEPG